MEQKWVKAVNAVLELQEECLKMEKENNELKQKVIGEDRWIPANELRPGAGKLVTMKFLPGNGEWIGDIDAELSELKPESYNQLLWLKGSEIDKPENKPSWKHL